MQKEKHYINPMKMNEHVRILGMAFSPRRGGSQESIFHLVTFWTPEQFWIARTLKKFISMFKIWLISVNNMQLACKIW